MTSKSNAIPHRMAGAFGWLMLDRAIRMGLGFVVGILIARYYGPSEWGMLSYVLASATLFGSVATAGAEDIILRDLSQVKSPQDLANIQKTAFILRLIFGFIAFLALITLVGLSQGMGVFFYMSVVYGILFVFQASEIWEYRLRIEHRIAVIARTHILTSVVSTVVKLVCVVFGLPLIYITASMSGEYAANMGLLSRYNARHWSNWVGKFDAKYAKNLLSSSLLVMVSGILVACQLRTEFYLIDYFLGIESLGIYAAAFKLMELFDIMVVIFSMIMIPELAKRNTIELPVLASRIYLLGIIFFLVMLLPILLAYMLFPWIYGQQYVAAQDLILWLALKPLFIILGSIRSMFLVLDGRLQYVPFCAFIGLLSSICLGWHLIPMFGLTGAAISGIVSLFISNFVLDLFFQPENIRRMSKSFSQLPYAYDRGLQLFGVKK